MNAVRVIFLLVVGFVFCVAGAVRGQDMASEAAGVPSVAVEAPVVADAPAVADAPVAADAPAVAGAPVVVDVPT